MRKEEKNHEKQLDTMEIDEHAKFIWKQIFSIKAVPLITSPEAHIINGNACQPRTAIVKKLRY